MQNFLIGVFGFLAGLALIVYRYKVVRFTGKIDWAEKYLGSGGTYNLVVIIGLVVWIGCLVYATGTFDTIFGFLAILN